MSWVPTRAQFFALGLSAESCVAPVRPVSAVDVATDTLTLAGHGFEEADLLRFVATGEGLGLTATLPAPLSASVLYEAVPVGGDLFQVRPNGGGAVINLTSAGEGVIGVVADWMSKLDIILTHRARWVDDHAIPYTPPFATPPESFVICACELAALDFAMSCRASSPSYSLEDVRTRAAAAQAWLDKLRSGKPLAVTPVDSTPGKVELGARGFSHRPSRGWKVDCL